MATLLVSHGEMIALHVGSMRWWISCEKEDGREVLIVGTPDPEAVETLRRKGPCKGVVRLACKGDRDGV